MKKVLSLGVLVILLFSVVGISYAQEVAEETDYSFGTVKSVTGDQLVVTEYDYEADKDVDITYTVDPAAKLENVDAVANIKAGDSIEIDFISKDGKKIAKALSVEKPLPEGEETA
jgi:hypothetical protein